MNPKYNWLRWIAILPATVAAYFLTFFLSNLFFYVVQWLNADHSNITVYTIPIISAGLAGYCFVAAGYYLAPSSKETVGLILLIIFTLITGASILMLIIYKFETKGLLEIIGQTIGSVVCYISIRYGEMD